MNTNKLVVRIGLVAATMVVVVIAGLNHATRAQEATQPASTQPAHAMMWQSVTGAVCVLTPTEGSSVSGVVTFTEADGKVAVSADVTGLEPNSTHGIHIHEYGDISKSNGKGCGGHYNPQGNAHGLPGRSPIRHAGDLGNLTADEHGNAHYEIVVDNITIAGLVNPIIGRGMIVHAGADDGGQPTGNAGARLAQGVIGIAKAGP